MYAIRVLPKTVLQVRGNICYKFSIMKNCLFCLKSCSKKPPPPPDGGIVGASNCKSLEAQLLQHFVLRKLLDVPGDRCEESLKWEDGSDDANLRACLKCSEVVWEAWDIHQKLVTLEVRLKEAKEEIKRSMLGSLKKLRKGQLVVSSWENEIRMSVFPEEMAARCQPKKMKIEGLDEMKSDPSITEKRVALRVKVEDEGIQDGYLNSLSDSEDYAPEPEKPEAIALTKNKSVNRKRNITNSEQNVKAKKKRPYAKRQRRPPRKSAKEPHRCKFCPARFREPQPLQDHLAIHEESKKMGLECEICFHPAITKKELEGHKFHAHDDKSKNFSRPFACGVCDFTNKKWKVLRDHATKEHPNIPEDELGPDFQLKCKVCSILCKGAPFLIKHQKYEHPELFGVPSVPVQCELCPELLPNILHLQYHLKAKHKRLNSFICDLCGKAYDQQAHLDKHRAAHDSRNQHICDLCGATYVYRDGLSQHYKNFHPEISKNQRTKAGAAKATSGDSMEEKFSCKYCDLKFTFKISMIRHMKTHKESMGIQCEICSKYYFTIQSLKLHMKLNHPTSDQKTQCKFCFKVFPNHHYMHTHVVKYCKLKKIDGPSATSLLTQSEQSEGGEPQLLTNIELNPVPQSDP